MAPSTSPDNRYVAVDTALTSDNTWATKHNGTATKWPQAGNDARGGWAVRARRRDETRVDYLTDALALLDGWTRDGPEINRILRLDDAQHAALTERVKVIADALQLRPTIRRLDGRTLIRVGTVNGALTAGEVTLAARIEDVYRAIVKG